MRAHERPERPHQGRPGGQARPSANSLPAKDSLGTCPVLQEIDEPVPAGPPGLLYPHQPEIRFALGHESDETADLRVDRFAELAAAEDAVMSQSLGQQMFPFVGGNVPAE